MKDYLQRIGRVALLSAEQEVELNIRTEAGVPAEEKLNSGIALDPQLSRDLAWLAQDGQLPLPGHEWVTCAWRAAQPHATLAA